MPLWRFVWCCNAQWIPKIKRFYKDAKILLVATRSDRVNEKDAKIVPTSKGQDLCVEAGASGFIECSALTGFNVQETFRLATEILKTELEQCQSNGECCLV